MAKSDGTVYVDTLIDTKGFGKGVNTMQKQVSDLSGAIGKLGAAIAATFAVGKLIQFGKEAIQLGSDLEEVQNVVDVTFTTMNEQVNEFARNAAESAGLSETMAKRYVGTFGAMSKAFGFAENEAFEMSTALTQLAGDVASFYNISQDEAYTKLKSVFTGETETLKDLGVVMTQNALDSYAMAKGYGKTTKAMTEQEKVALRYSFVLDQLSASQGDFVRTSDSWANQTRILSLTIDSLKANIGQGLINIFNPLLKVINQVVAKMAELSKYFVAFSELIVGKSTSGGGGSPGDGLAEIQDGYDGITDAIDEATKAQNKYFTGLDEIKTFAENKSVDTSAGGTSGLAGLASSTAEEVEDTASLIEELEQKYPELIKFAQDSIAKLKEIFADFSVGDFFEAGKDTSELVSGIFNFFARAIDDVEWRNIGNKIGEFLEGLEWLEIMEGLKNVIWKAVKGALELWFGMFEEAPFETAITTAMALWKFTKVGEKLSKLISGALKKQGVSVKDLAITVGAITLALEGTLDIGKELSKKLIEWSNEKYGTEYETDFIDSLDWSDILFDIGPEQFLQWTKNPLWTMDVWSRLLFGYDSFSELLDSLFSEIELPDSISNFLSKASDAFEGLRDGIESIKATFSDSSIVKAIDNITNYLEGLSTRASQIFEGLKITIQGIWKVVSEWFNENVVVPMVDFFKNLWESVSGFFSQLWTDIEAIWSTVFDWFNQKIIEPVKNAFEKACEAIGDFFSGLWHGIKSGVVGAMNAVIGGIESAINFIVNGINKIIDGFNKVVSWAAKVAEVNWGGVDLIPQVSIPRVNVPMLATGAVIPPNAPFMAMLGDQKHGTNIEAPLDTIKQAVREVIGNGNGGGQYRFTAQINRRTLFDEMIEEAKLRQSSAGRNPFDLKI